MVDDEDSDMEDIVPPSPKRATLDSVWRSITLNPVVTGISDNMDPLPCTSTDTHPISASEDLSDSKQETYSEEGCHDMDCSDVDTDPAILSDDELSWIELGTVNCDHGFRYSFGFIL